MRRWKPQTDARVLRGQKGVMIAFIHTTTRGQTGVNGVLGAVMQKEAARKSRLV